jgi:hypothetical protein
MDSKSKGISESPAGEGSAGKKNLKETDPPEEKLNACGLPAHLGRDSSDLCCCYIIDPNDQYADPCELPVDESCCV